MGLSMTKHDWDSFDHWSTADTDTLRAFIAYLIRLRDDHNAEIKRLRDRLQFDPGGSDKIDELEQCIEFLRHDLAISQKERDDARTDYAVASTELEQLKEQIAGMPSDVVVANAIIEWMSRALDGEMPSDFAASYAPVSKAIDAQLEIRQLKAMIEQLVEENRYLRELTGDP